MRRLRARAARGVAPTLAAVLLLVLSTSGCGRKQALTVSAAASLKSSFTSYAQRFKQADVRFSFGGSDLLAAQIEQGFKPDIFAAANLTLPRQLYAKRLVEKPVVFAANELVLVVPSRSRKVKSLDDVEKPGVKLAIGSGSVPVGSYTRMVLARLGGAGSARVLANVRSEEPDVSGIVGKLTEGAVDAGFTYLTDVRATHGALRAIPLPPKLRPAVAYGAAIVNGSGHQTQARAFLDGLLRGDGRQQLLAAGFLPPTPP